MNIEAEPPVWQHKARTIIGVGEVQRIDPGVGLGRYEAALEALVEAGGEIAFASFTFDPDEPGSVVLVPAGIEETEISTDHPLPAGRVVAAGVEAWRSAVAEAMESLEAGIVEKITLSRQVDLSFEDRVPVETVIARLIRDQPECYIFAVDGLVGASPELLVSLDDGRISSVALAGTSQAYEGLATAKMAREHAHTVDSVSEGLKPHLTRLEELTQRVLEFGEIKHLSTAFAGEAIDGTTVLRVLEDLHPTAAVAGTPRDKATHLIGSLEPRSRGRYAGPVGWFDSGGDGEFAIALRCGLIKGSRARLFAGGGLVPGSDTAAELEETELKLGPMLEALGIK